jgi:hypothetical protein
MIFNGKYFALDFTRNLVATKKNSQESFDLFVIKSNKLSSTPMKPYRMGVGMVCNIL